ncbi:MAG: BREX-3 system P-loop-containing protein BrxF [Acholeplasmatales bacterium]|jgi:adenylate kinase family enzyme|nr:BREX-3 system P-loop-containing protein BrxF [Acholeplasmatales bacterium]
MQLIDELSKKKYYLLLIIGKPGSGKSKYLHNYSKQEGIPVLDLDFILGKEIPDGKDNNYVYDFVSGFLDTYTPKQVLLDKKAILYHKNSNINLLEFLKKLSKQKTVISTWNGYTENGKLYHLNEKGEVDFEYDLSDDYAYIELK